MSRSFSGAGTVASPVDAAAVRRLALQQLADAHQPLTDPADIDTAASTPAMSTQTAARSVVRKPAPVSLSASASPSDLPAGFEEVDSESHLSSIVHAQSRLIARVLREKQLLADENMRNRRTMRGLDRRVRSITRALHSREVDESEAADSSASAAVAADAATDPLSLPSLTPHVHDTAQIVTIAEDNVRLLHEMQSLTAIVAYFFGQTEEAIGIAEDALQATDTQQNEHTQALQEVHELLSQLSVSLLDAQDGSADPESEGVLAIPIQSVLARYLALPAVQDIKRINEEAMMQPVAYGDDEKTDDSAGDPSASVPAVSVRAPLFISHAGAQAAQQPLSSLATSTEAVAALEEQVRHLAAENDELHQRLLRAAAAAITPTANTDQTMRTFAGSTSSQANGTTHSRSNSRVDPYQSENAAVWSEKEATYRAQEAQLREQVAALEKEIASLRQSPQEAKNDDTKTPTASSSPPPPEADTEPPAAAAAPDVSGLSLEDLRVAYARAAVALVDASTKRRASNLKCHRLAEEKAALSNAREDAMRERATLLQRIIDVEAIAAAHAQRAADIARDLERERGRLAHRRVYDARDKAAARKKQMLARHRAENAAPIFHPPTAATVSRREAAAAAAARAARDHTLGEESQSLVVRPVDQPSPPADLFADEEELVVVADDVEQHARREREEQHEHEAYPSQHDDAHAFDESDAAAQAAYERAEAEYQRQQADLAANEEAHWRAADVASQTHTTPANADPRKTTTIESWAPPPPPEAFHSSLLVSNAHATTARPPGHHSAAATAASSRSGTPAQAAMSSATAATIPPFQSSSISNRSTPQPARLKSHSFTPPPLAGSGSTAAARNATSAYRLTGMSPAAPLNSAFHTAYAMPPSVLKLEGAPSTSAVAHAHQRRYVLVDASKRTAYLHHRSPLPVTVATRNLALVGVAAQSGLPLGEVHRAKPLPSSSSVPYEPDGHGATSATALALMAGDAAAVPPTLSRHSSLNTSTTVLSHHAQFPDPRTRPLVRQNAVLAERQRAANHAERFFVLGGSHGADGYRHLQPKIDSRWQHTQANGGALQPPIHTPKKPAVQPPAQLPATLQPPLRAPAQHEYRAIAPHSEPRGSNPSLPHDAPRPPVSPQPLPHASWDEDEQQHTTGTLAFDK